MTKLRRAKAKLNLINSTELPVIELINDAIDIGDKSLVISELKKKYLKIIEENTPKSKQTEINYGTTDV